MNGPQDAGGRHGFGPVIAEHAEPLFHADWERRALGIVVAAGAGGHWTLDEARFAREDRAPAEYYALSYYRIWLGGLERLLLEKGLVTARELASGRAMDATVSPKRRLAAADVAGALAKGSPVDRDPVGRNPAFAVGDCVRTRNLQPRGHIRLPGYVRDKPGRIDRIHGCHVFADTSARGDHATAHFLYAVTFSARDLWGDDASAHDEVTLDLWEPYLDPR